MAAGRSVQRLNQFTFFSNLGESSCGPKLVRRPEPTTAKNKKKENGQLVGTELPPPDAQHKFDFNEGLVFLSFRRPKSTRGDLNFTDTAH